MVDSRGYTIKQLHQESECMDIQSNKVKCCDSVLSLMLSLGE